MLKITHDPIIHAIVTETGVAFGLLLKLITDWDTLVENSSKIIRNIFRIVRPLERRIKERRHTVFNPIQAFTIAEEDLAKLTTAIATIQTNLPLIAKIVGDVGQAAADEKNPAALMQDLPVLLTDTNTALQIIASLLPKPSTPPPAAS
jgi:hypothetical protein